MKVAPNSSPCDPPPAYDNIIIKMIFYQVELKNQTHYVADIAMADLYTHIMENNKVIMSKIWPHPEATESIISPLTKITHVDLGWSDNTKQIQDISGILYKGIYHNFIHDNKLYIEVRPMFIIRFDIKDTALEKLEVLTNEMIRVQNELTALKIAYEESQKQLALFTTESGLFFKVMIDKCLMDWRTYNANYKNGKIYYTYYTSKLDKPLETDIAVIEHIVVDDIYHNDVMQLMACSTCSQCVWALIRNSNNYRLLKYALSFIKDNKLKNVKQISLGNVFYDHRSGRKSIKDVRDEQIKQSSYYFACNSHRQRWTPTQGKKFNPDLLFDYIEMSILNELNKIVMNKLEVYLVYPCSSTGEKPVLELEYEKNHVDVNHRHIAHVSSNSCIIQDTDMNEFKNLSNITWIDN
jgi:hypothetical protein